MNIISSDLVAAVKSIAPQRVAVAYIGKEWSDLIDTTTLKEIIVSPTLGSNPRAIVEVAKLLGWENVHFLNELHSKLYIGKKQLILGSANLSANGLGLNTQHEACVMLADSGALADANALFEIYKAEAQHQYHDMNSKLEQVDRLQAEWNLARVHGLLKKSGDACLTAMSNNQLFSQYDSDCDGLVYVAWYMSSGDYDYTEKVSEAVQHDIVSEIHLAADDQAPINQWVLSWAVTNKGYASKKIKPALLFIHEKIMHGVTDTDYEQLCYQRASLNTPPKPFDETDPLFIDCFRRVMDQDRFEELRGHIGEDVWYICNYKALTKEFLKELQEEYQRQSRR